VPVQFLAGILAASLLLAKPAFFPLKDVKPGMRGTGRTVFSGDRTEEFQVEILGTMENVGPKQSLVLARLSGGPLDKTGVLQGMSGSPVYIDGKLLGAVALAFSFSKEPIAAIRPIGELLRVTRSTDSRPVLAKASLWDKDLTQRFARPETVAAGDALLTDIATPIHFGGFTRNTIEDFSPQLRALGLEPRQGIAGGGNPPPGLGDPAKLVPGSMISVQLMSGDLSIGADGTVTHIDGKQVYAFGHRFLSIGATELPFARSDVLAVLPNLAASFKISAPREWMGTITEDRSAAVSGELGRRASMVPLAITVTRRPGGARADYNIEMARDRFLAPFLLQMAVYSALDATERNVGSSTLSIRGEVEFQDGTAPIRLSNMYAGEYSLPQQVSLATAVPVAYALQSGFERLQLRKVKLDIESFDEKKQLQIDQVWVSRREARPGETVELTVVLTGPNGAEQARKVPWTIPSGAPAGAVYFTVADGNTTNFAEFRQLIGSTPRSPAQLVSFLNSLRGNTKAYVRIWRADPSFDVQGEDLPSPPPSLAQILSRNQAALGGGIAWRNSKIGEIEIGAGEAVIAGSKTVQVEIKE
jgi:hypothetical protein